MGIIFKVDFEKAYNFVDWEYVNFVLMKMGFPCLWRNWIMECVSTASVLVLVNGNPIEEIVMGRDLHQGDLLSPFLFVLVAEGHSVIISTVVEVGVTTKFAFGWTMGLVRGLCVCTA